MQNFVKLCIVFSKNDDKTTIINIKIKYLAQPSYLRSRIWYTGDTKQSPYLSNNSHTSINMVKGFKKQLKYKVASTN